MEGTCLGESIDSDGLNPAMRFLTSAAIATHVGGKNNVTVTVILLSEKFDRCLVVGVLNSFGIAASDISAETLIDVCALYDGRRLGLRDRQSLAREIPKLRDLCITKAEAIR